MTGSAAVIIPHFNDHQRLMRCLAALLPQVTNGVRVIVVDNGSTPPPVLPDTVTLFHEGQAGAAHARNRGVAGCDCERLFFLDADCIPAPDWLARAMACTGDVTGGAVQVFDETPRPRSGAQAFETVFAFDNRAYIERQRFSVSANLVTTRRVFAATGPFRAGLSEDQDWCHRAIAAGFALTYDPALVVAHPSRGDWPALRKKWRRLTDELWGLRAKGPVARIIWAGRAATMPLSALAHSPRVLRHPDLTAQEKRRALATLWRLRMLRMGWMLAQDVSAGG